MKTLVSIAKSIFALVKYGVSLAVSLLRQRLAQRRGEQQSRRDTDATPRPLPA